MEKKDEKELRKEFENIQKNGDLQYLANLKARWADEKEYEDWSDYEKAIRERFKRLEIAKVTKKPFGVHFYHKGRVIKLELRVKGNYVTGTMDYL